MLLEGILQKKGDPIDLVLEAILEAGKLEPTIVCYLGGGDLLCLEVDIVTDEKYHSPILREIKKIVKSRKAKDG